MIDHLSFFLSPEDGEEIGKPVTLSEIEEALKQFSKDKSPSPNGWTLELLLTFFDMIVSDILAMVEKSILEGYIYGALNSFYTLIPMCNNTRTFNEFRPIAL